MKPVTPLELIKHGVLTHDFQSISQAYTLLTGEILNVPSENQVVEAAIKNAPPLIPRRSNGIDVDDFRMQIIDKSKQGGENKSLTRAEPINIDKNKVIGNLFSDAGDIATEDKAFDKAVHIKVPVQRKREAPKTEQFKCEECGKKEVLSPIHAATGRFVCTECTSKKAKGR